MRHFDFYRRTLTGAESIALDGSVRGLVGSAMVKRSARSTSTRNYPPEVRRMDDTRREPHRGYRKSITDLGWWEGRGVGPSKARRVHAEIGYPGAGVTIRRCESRRICSRQVRVARSLSSNEIWRRSASRSTGRVVMSPEVNAYYTPDQRGRLPGLILQRPLLRRAARRGRPTRRHRCGDRVTRSVHGFSRPVARSSTVRADSPIGGNRRTARLRSARRRR